MRAAWLLCGRWWKGGRGSSFSPPHLSLYKTLFCVWAFVQIIILFFAHTPFV